MRRVIIITTIFILISLLLIIKNNKFYLEDKYYNNSDIILITDKELSELEKESFALLIYQPFCFTSSSFEDITTQYTKENNLTFYKISFSDIKKTVHSKTIKHYPSFALFKDGKLKNYLDPDKHEDLDYYKSVSGFNKWFTKYIKL